jgi:uncharacterized protein
MTAGNQSFPSVPQAAVLLLAGFLLQYIVGAALYDARESLNLSSNQMGALVMLLANGVLLAFIMQYRDMTYRDLLHSTRSSVIAALLLLVPPVLLLVPAIVLIDQVLIASLERLFPLSLWEEQAFANMVSGNVAAVVSTCLLAPVLEEMLFRGVFLRAFLVQQPRWAAIAYSALLFGVAHLNIYQFVLAFLLGLLLGWLFERSRSLIPCIALHGALNSWIVASELAGDDGAKRAIESATPLTWTMAVAAAVLAAWLLKRVLFSREVPSSTHAE